VHDVTVWPEHPGRRARRTALAALDPWRDAHEIYRTIVLLDLPFELKLGLNLAFYRTFAAPRIAALLAHTGEMAHNPHKRAFDTGLIIYEIITHGFANQRSRQVIAALNRMHGRWPIAQEDHRYVLSAFVVAPTRFVDAWGWRGLTAQERIATACFYAELGTWMGIRDIPMTYDGFAQVFDEYEDRHLSPSTAGDHLMALTRGVIAEQLPRLLRPVARPLAGRMTAALIDDRLAACLGLTPAGPGERATARAVFALRRALERRRPPRTDPSFTPGSAVAAHPDGYRLDDLGVDADRPLHLRND
jgi:hypothetical protein